MTPAPPDLLPADPMAHITRRAIAPEDTPFLLALYTTTRVEEMTMVPWTEEQKRDFVAQQFHAQHTDYHRNHPDGRFDLLLWDGEPFGRLYTDTRGGLLNIMEITLDPAWRERGIGTALLTNLLGMADADGLHVVLYVEPQNPALRLYRRLGFAVMETEGYYWRLER